MLNSSVLFKEFNQTNSTNSFGEGKMNTRVHLIALTVFFVLTLIGNLIVILIIIFSKTNKSFCLSFNNVSRMSFYIFNLSIADINVAIMSILPQIFEIDNVFFLSNLASACKIVKFAQVFSVYASTYVLIQMGIDRYNCICKPIKSFIWTPKNASYGIILSWLIAALFASPQLFIFSIKHNEAVLGDTCFASFGEKGNPNWERAYVIYHALLQFFIPLFILIFLYTKIFIAVSNIVSSKKASLRMSNNPAVSISATETTDYNRKSKFQSNSSTKLDYNKCIDYTNRINEKIPMFKHKKLALPMNERSLTSSSISINRETQIRQNITKKSLYILAKSKIKTFKLTLTVVLTFILCTLPFYTVQLTLTIVGKPSKLSDDVLRHIWRKFLEFFFLIL